MAQKASWSLDPLPVKEEVVERAIGVVVANLAGDVGAGLVGQA